MSIRYRRTEQIVPDRGYVHVQPWQRTWGAQTDHPNPGQNPWSQATTTRHQPYYSHQPCTRNQRSERGLRIEFSKHLQADNNLSLLTSSAAILFLSLYPPHAHTASAGEHEYECIGNKKTGAPTLPLRVSFHHKVKWNTYDIVILWFPPCPVWVSYSDSSIVTDCGSVSIL